MNKTESIVWRAFAALLSLAGMAGFIVLFARDMTVFWFILSPLILIVYQFPAFVVFRMWRRKRARAQAPEIDEAWEQGDDGGAGAAPDPAPGEDGREGY